VAEAYHKSSWKKAETSDSKGLCPVGKLLIMIDWCSQIPQDISLPLFSHEASINMAITGEFVEIFTNLALFC
jgi:hypothetical protein